MKNEILRLLETDSKLSPKDIAAMLGLDEETVVNDIKAMEADKIICGYHTMIDWDKVAEEKVTALIEVKVTPQRPHNRSQPYPERNVLHPLSALPSAHSSWQAPHWYQDVL